MVLITNMEALKNPQNLNLVQELIGFSVRTGLFGFVGQRSDLPISSCMRHWHARAPTHAARASSPPPSPLPPAGQSGHAASFKKSELTEPLRYRPTLLAHAVTHASTHPVHAQ